MFDVLVTIIGSLDDEAEALTFARDLEDQIARARRLGLVIEVRDNRLAKIIHKRSIVPAKDASG